ncbi:hypothetical protein [Reyranella sp.]|jgi:hypothetical protein|uniref:hypothetical protein n=1 Tax=Reyranella sp. TaxID=1929291 RepID=UPI002F9363EE
MSARVTIAGRALFGEERLRILSAFDAYARAARAQGVEPSVTQFHSLKGAELGFSARSLRRWVALRRQYTDSNGTGPRFG